jgi:hypothetical protein
MQDPAECRRFAAECKRMAETHPNIREALLEMERAWLKRAEVVEKKQSDGK